MLPAENHPHQFVTPFFLLIRVGVKKSDKRRFWHFMERERRPRKRRDLKGVTLGDSRTITKRLDLTCGSSLGFRLRPRNRRDPELRRDRRNQGPKKKKKKRAIRNACSEERSTTAILS